MVPWHTIASLPRLALVLPLEYQVVGESCDKTQLWPFLQYSSAIDTLGVVLFYAAKASEGGRHASSTRGKPVLLSFPQTTRKALIQSDHYRTTPYYSLIQQRPQYPTNPPSHATTLQPPSRKILPFISYSSALKKTHQINISYVALGLSFEAHLLLPGSLLRHLFLQHRHVLIEQTLAVTTSTRAKRTQKETGQQQERKN